MSPLQYVWNHFYFAFNLDRYIGQDVNELGIQHKYYFITAHAFLKEGENKGFFLVSLAWVYMWTFKCIKLTK